jgi:hypothetical protein
VIIMVEVARRRSILPGLRIGGSTDIGSAVTAKLKSIVRRLGETDCDMPETWRDPLSHPVIRGMSAREIADLPFVAGCGQRQCR